MLATSGEKRSAYLPDVPTLVEQGYPDLVVREWFPFFAPAHVSQAKIDELSLSLAAAIARRGLVSAFADSGKTPASSTPAALALRIRTEQRYWEPILRATGVRVE